MRPTFRRGWGALFIAVVGATELAAAAEWESPAHIALESNRVVAVGAFAPGKDWQEVKFQSPTRARYFCLEALSSLDGKPYAAVAELELLDESGRFTSHEGWKIVRTDSVEREREDGAAQNAIDRDESTHWHTRWSEPTANYPHLLVLDLGKVVTLTGFDYLPRQGGPIAGGRIKDFRVSVAEELREKSPPIELLPETVYLFSYFMEQGADGLHLAWSRDGYQWELVNDGDSVFSPAPAGNQLVRDPCLLRGPDGRFRLVWTCWWTGESIGYAESPDLIHWSAPTNLPVMADLPGTRNCWAPEIYWDAPREQYLVTWCSVVTNRFRETLDQVYDGNNDRIYFTVTKDFKTFAPAKLFYDPGCSAIDATVFTANHRRYLVFKDESSFPDQKNLRLAVADDLLGPYGPPGPAFSPGWVEGPAVFSARGEYVCAFHYYGNNTWGALKSADLTNWTDVSDRLNLPPKSHSGTVLEVPREVLVSLWRAGRAEIGPAPETADLGLGHWIWSDSIQDKQVCRLWRAFELPAGAVVSQATLRITADNGYRVFLDGREIGRGGDFNDLTEYNVTQLLAAGRHVLAVEGFNDALAAGVIAGLHIQFLDGKKLAVLSDPAWFVVPEEDRNWMVRQQPAGGWRPASIVGLAGKFGWVRPKRILTSPPILRMEIRFWQRGWFLFSVVAAALAAVVVSVHQGMRLAVQARSQKLLERERARIASDMHDDLGSGLTQLTLLGELVLREMPRTGESRHRVLELTAKARRLLRCMDEIIWVVNPRRDTVRDFAAFVSEHAQEFLAATEIRCRQEVAAELPDRPLELPQRRNLLLAVKEAIRNAARHSGAREVNLRVQVVEQCLTVIVADDGRGFSEADTPENRNGLANMRQRLAEIGGSIQLRTAPGHGCQITFKLPLLPGEIHSRPRS
jgi:signal transduction histidine kinase